MTHLSKKRVVLLALGIYSGADSRTGAEVRARQNLVALRELGFAVTLLTTPDPEGRAFDGEVVWLEPQAAVSFVHYYTQWRYRRKIRRVVARYASDPSTILFCEHWAAMLCCPRRSRVVYSFHDFESRLTIERRLRKGMTVTLKTRLYWRLSEWLERRMVGGAARVLSVSASEANKLRDEWHADAVYIPIVPAGNPPTPGEFDAVMVRLWFYGSSGATSNKIALDHLVGGLFDRLKAALPAAEFHQMGKYDTYDANKIEWLRRNFQVHGFVADPARIFRPGDICLIPYQKDTGFRTKIPEVCGYGMIPAGYPETFACCPEMRDGYNCIVAANPEVLAARLAEISKDSEARRRLAAGAIETRQRDFSCHALLEQYRRVLDFPS